MLEVKLQALKYPIGNLHIPEEISAELLSDSVDSFASFPIRLIELCKDLEKEKLSWRYRPEGWNIKQVIHHCLDSHINSYVRFKLSLTEETPAIRPYIESKWAELSWSKDDNIIDTLEMLLLLHKKLARIMQDLNNDELERAYFHPADNRNYKLKEAIVLYGWHCNHHLAHIEQAIASEGIY